MGDRRVQPVFDRYRRVCQGCRCSGNMKGYEQKAFDKAGREEEKESEWEESALTSMQDRRYSSEGPLGQTMLSRSD